MKKVVFFSFSLLFSITDQLQICRPHQGSLPQGRRVRLLLQPGLGRDAHQPGDAEAPGRAEQVGAEAAGSRDWSCSVGTSGTSETFKV